MLVHDFILRSLNQVLRINQLPVAFTFVTKKFLLHCICNCTQTATLYFFKSSSSAECLPFFYKSCFASNAQIIELLLIAQKKTFEEKKTYRSSSHVRMMCLDLQVYLTDLEIFIFRISLF
jgi:hypothetical protein